MVGLTEGQLGLGAANGDLLALGGLAGPRAGARAGQGRGGARAWGAGGDGEVLRAARTNGGLGEEATGVARSRRGRAAKAARPAAASGFFFYSY